jgi:hypothetical protein
MNLKHIILETILSESHLENIIKKYSKYEVPEVAIRDLSMADPSGNNGYLEWMIIEANELGGFDVESLEAVVSAAECFHNNLKHINRFVVRDVLEALRDVPDEIYYEILKSPRNINVYTLYAVEELCFHIKNKKDFSGGYGSYGGYGGYGGYDNTIDTKSYTPEQLEEMLTRNVKKGDTLIIHPDDRTTDFLKPSYAGLNATVLTTKEDMYNLKETMKNHRRIILMGHGSPGGLMLSMIGGVEGVELNSSGQYVKYKHYSVGYDFLNILKTKSIVAVWCNADRFVVPNDLHGFYTGMVISELCEANYCQVHGCDDVQLQYSNTLFTKALKAALPIDSPESVDVFKNIYNGDNNQIIDYNKQRIYYR